jgi:hypothetical protein
MNVGKATKAESSGPEGKEGGATSQPPKVGQVVDPGDGLVGQREVLKTELPHLASEGADKTELQM